MGNKIIKLHGCSGAGKTTAARALITAAKAVHIITPDNSDKPEAYCCEFQDYDAPVFVLGSYANNCGGMDTVSNAKKAIEMVHFYVKEGHVLHEGLLQSTYYGEMGKDSEQFGDDYIYAFLNTPILVCLDRVTRRRDVQQSKNKFNPKLTIEKYKTIERLKTRCKQNGRRVVDFDYQADPVGQFHSLFRGAA